jgi:hypothetical protein
VRACEDGWHVAQSMTHAFNLHQVTRRYMQCRRIDVKKSVLDQALRVDAPTKPNLATGRLDDSCLLGKLDVL